MIACQAFPARVRYRSKFSLLLQVLVEAGNLVQNLNTDQVMQEGDRLAIWQEHFQVLEYVHRIEIKQGIGYLHLIRSLNQSLCALP